MSEPRVVPPRTPADERATERKANAVGWIARIRQALTEAKERTK